MRFQLISFKRSNRQTWVKGQKPGRMSSTAHSGSATSHSKGNGDRNIPGLPMSIPVSFDL